MPNRRAKLELVTPAASPEEAAAVIAAVERFLGRLEGVSEQSGRFPWGDPHPWG